MYEERVATNPSLSHVTIGVLPNHTLRTGVSQVQCNVIASALYQVGVVSHIGRRFNEPTSLK